MALVLFLDAATYIKN